jgi:hypothetical protein
VIIFDDLKHDDVPMPEEGDGGRRADEGGSAGGGPTEEARREGKLDVRNSWQVIAGSILIPLGVVLIMISWYGAAHARVVQQQIPYLVSGSFVGLGCMVVGGLCYWGHWLYRTYDQADLHHEEQMRMLEAIAVALGGRTVVDGRSSQDGASAYYATATGSVYHRSDCAVIAHHPEDLRVLGASGLAGLRPCRICVPEGG